MSWLEQEIAHLQKRIDKIKINPDPNRPASNLMLYECERDRHIEELKAWREGTPPIVAAIGSIEPLLNSMGLIAFDYEHAADRQMIADEYADVASAEGFPEKACDRTIVEVAMITKGMLPPPKFVVAANVGCDPMYYAALAFAQRFNVPYYILDIPLEPNQANLAYVTEQLRELIDALQEKLPCHAPDMQHLAHIQDCQRRAVDLMHEVYKLRRKKPCPMPTMDAFRLPPLPSGFPDPEKMIAYHQAFRDEIEAKAEQAQKVEEKLRVMWACTAPYFANPFHVLDRKGAKIVIFQIDVVARVFARLDPCYGDEQYGRKLTPLEEEARMCFCCSWVGKGTRWIDAIMRVAKDLDIEAIVNFVQMGCTATVGLGKLIADAAEKEGIPTFNVEGRQMISRDYNKAAFEAQLEQFIDVCLTRKAALPAGR